MIELGSSSVYDAWFFAALGAHVALIGLTALQLVAWCRLHPERRVGVEIGVFVALMFTHAFFTWVPSTAIPAAWVTALQEGLDAQNILTLYGRGVHAGPNFRFLTVALAGADVPTLRDVVRMNLWFAGLNAIVFFLLARHVLASRWAAALFTLAFVGNVVFLHASLSELPSQACTTYFFVGVLAAAVLGERARLKAPVAFAALATLALLTVLTALTRPELAGFGVLALAVAGAPFALGEPRWISIQAALTRWLVGIPTWSRRRKLTVVSVLMAPVPLFHSLGRWGGWITEGLHPLNASFLTMPGVLWLLWLPLGVIVLLVLGTIHALRHLERFLALPISVIVLYRTYYSASHLTFYELLRYMTYLTPSAFFMALFGWRELEETARRRGWVDNWREHAIPVLGVLCVAAPLPGVREKFLHGDYQAGFDLHQVLLTRNQQIEVRYMLDLIDRQPQCVFVGRVSRVDRNLGPIREYNLILFGRPLRQPITEPDRGESLEDVVARAAPGVQCARAFRGLDCNLTNSDGCHAMTRGRTLIERRTFGSLPYNDVPERGETGPLVDLGVYAIAVR